MADRSNFDPGKPHAFLSYTRADDEYLEAGISWLRSSLERAVRAHTGTPFQIFQDVEDIEHGENWEKKLSTVLESAQLFIPILTPSFFTSEFCRREANSFLDYEARTSREDLILPVYLIDTEVLNDPEARAKDALVVRLRQRQYADWREFRFTLRDRTTRPRIEGLAATLARAAKHRVLLGLRKNAGDRKEKNKAVSKPFAFTPAMNSLAQPSVMSEPTQVIETHNLQDRQVEAEFARQKEEIIKLAKACQTLEAQAQDARKQASEYYGIIKDLRGKIKNNDEMIDIKEKEIVSLQNDLSCRETRERELNGNLAQLEAQLRAQAEKSGKIIPDRRRRRGNVEGIKDSIIGGIVKNEQCASDLIVKTTEISSDVHFDRKNKELSKYNNIYDNSTDEMGSKIEKIFQIIVGFALLLLMGSFTFAAFFRSSGVQGL